MSSVCRVCVCVCLCEALHSAALLADSSPLQLVQKSPLFSPPALQLDVDAYVVKCDYNNFTFMVLSERNPTGETTLSIKLYSESTLPAACLSA